MMDKEQIIGKINKIIDLKEAVKTAERELAGDMGAIISERKVIRFVPSRKWNEKLAGTDPETRKQMMEQALNEEGVAVDYRLADCRPGTGIIKEIEIQEDGVSLVLEDIDTNNEVTITGDDVIDLIPVAQFVLESCTD